MPGNTFKCNKCDMVFSSAANRYRHINGVHLKVVECNCPVCGKGFTQNCNLERHMNTVHKNVNKRKRHSNVAAAKKSRLGSVLNSRRAVPVAKQQKLRFVRKPCPFKGRKISKGQKNPGSVHRCNTCSKIFFSRSRMLHHQMLHPSKTDRLIKMAKDSVKPVKVVMSLGKHQKASVRKESLSTEPTNKNKDSTCDVCGKHFVNKYSMLRHRNSHSKPSRHELKERTCTTCNRIYSDKYCLWKHITDVHSGVRKAKSTSVKSSLTNEERRNGHSSKSIEKNETVTPENVDQGEREKIDQMLKAPVDSMCLICNKKYSSDYTLKFHVETIHLKLRSFKCQFCTAGFNQRANLIRHIGRLHRGQPFQPQRNISKARYGRHRNPNSARRFQFKLGKDSRRCSVCSKVFSFRHSMLRHKRLVHASMKENVPKGKNTPQNEDLKAHVSTNSNVRNGDKQSGNTKVMQLPIKSDKKSRTCPIGSKVLSHGTNLGRHRVKHGTAACSYVRQNVPKVKKTDTEKGKIEKMMTITVNKPCLICKKRFARYQNLKSHVEAVHLKLKPHKCKFCDSAFHQKVNLLQHTMRWHSSVSSDDRAESQRKPAKYGRHWFSSSPRRLPNEPNRKSQIWWEKTSNSVNSKGQPRKDQDSISKQRLRKKPHDESRTCPICSKVLSVRSSMLRHKKLKHGSNAVVSIRSRLSTYTATRLPNKSCRKSLVPLEKKNNLVNSRGENRKERNSNYQESLLDSESRTYPICSKVLSTRSSMLQHKKLKHGSNAVVSIKRYFSRVEGTEMKEPTKENESPKSTLMDDQNSSKHLNQIVNQDKRKKVDIATMQRHSSVSPDDPGQYQRRATNDNLDRDMVSSSLRRLPVESDRKSQVPLEKTNNMRNRTGENSKDQNSNYQESLLDSESRTCPICSKVLSTRNSMLRHKKLKHGSNAVGSIRKYFSRVKVTEMKENESPKSTLTDDQNLSKYLTQIVNQDEREKIEMMLRSTEDKECLCCKKKFLRYPLLRRHVEAVHLNMRPHKCKICTYTSHQQVNLATHVKRKHSSRSTDERKAPKNKYRRRWNLSSLRRLPNKSFKESQICPICFKVLSCKQSMLRHKKVMHTLKTVTLIRQNGLWKQKTSEPEDPVVADEAQRHFVNKKHSIMDRTCDVCQKVHYYRKEMLMHRKHAHPTAPEIILKQCTVRLQRTDLEPPEQTSECTLVKKKHTREERTCDGCGKIFPYRSEMLRHRKVHTHQIVNAQVKPRRKRMSGLEVNKADDHREDKLMKKQGTGEDENHKEVKEMEKQGTSENSKPIEVKEMEKQVTAISCPQQVDILVGNQIDIGDGEGEKIKDMLKPDYIGTKCTICKYHCTSKIFLVRHVNAVHLKLRPYKCRQCGRLFSQRHNLKTHLKNIHGDKRASSIVVKDTIINTLTGLDAVTQSLDTILDGAATVSAPAKPLIPIETFAGLKSSTSGLTVETVSSRHRNSSGSSHSSWAQSDISSSPSVKSLESSSSMHTASISDVNGYFMGKPDCASDKTTHTESNTTTDTPPSTDSEENGSLTSNASNFSYKCQKRRGSPMVRHKSTYRVQRRSYNCGQCGQHFTLRRHLQIHILQVHGMCEDSPTKLTSVPDPAESEGVGDRDQQPTENKDIAKTIQDLLDKGLISKVPAPVKPAMCSVETLTSEVALNKASAAPEPPVNNMTTNRTKDSESIVDREQPTNNTDTLDEPAKYPIQEKDTEGDLSSVIEAPKLPLCINETESSTSSSDPSMMAVPAEPEMNLGGAESTDSNAATSSLTSGTMADVRPSQRSELFKPLLDPVKKESCDDSSLVSASSEAQLDPVRTDVHSTVSGLAAEAQSPCHLNTSRSSLCTGSDGSLRLFRTIGSLKVINMNDSPSAIGLGMNVRPSIPSTTTVGERSSQGHDTRPLHIANNDNDRERIKTLGSLKVMYLTDSPNTTAAPTEVRPSTMPPRTEPDLDPIKTEITEDDTTTSPPDLSDKEGVADSDRTTKNVERSDIVWDLLGKLSMVSASTKPPMCSVERERTEVIPCTSSGTPKPPLHDVKAKCTEDEMIPPGVVTEVKRSHHHNSLSPSHSPCPHSSWSESVVSTVDSKVYHRTVCGCTEATDGREHQVQGLDTRLSHNANNDHYTTAAVMEVKPSTRPPRTEPEVDPIKTEITERDTMKLERSDNIGDLGKPNMVSVSPEPETCSTESESTEVIPCTSSLTPRPPLHDMKTNGTDGKMTPSSVATEPLRSHHHNSLSPSHSPCPHSSWSESVGSTVDSKVYQRTVCGHVRTESMDSGECPSQGLDTRSSHSANNDHDTTAAVMEVKPSTTPPRTEPDVDPIKTEITERDTMSSPPELSDKENDSKKTAKNMERSDITQDLCKPSMVSVSPEPEMCSTESESTEVIPCMSSVTPRPPLYDMKTNGTDGKMTPSSVATEPLRSHHHNLLSPSRSPCPPSSWSESVGSTVDSKVYQRTVCGHVRTEPMDSKEYPSQGLDTRSSHSANNDHDTTAGVMDDRPSTALPRTEPDVDPIKTEITERDTMSSPPELSDKENDSQETTKSTEGSDITRDLCKPNMVSVLPEPEACSTESESTGVIPCTSALTPRPPLHNVETKCTEDEMTPSSAVAEVPSSHHHNSLSPSRSPCPLATRPPHNANNDHDTEKSEDKWLVRDTWTYNCPSCNLQVRGSMNLVMHIRTHMQ